MPSYKHAVVIGGSMAGLMAAKVLSELFESVTVLDRDTLPDGPEIHKSAPQGAHLHILLESGKDAMEKFYPGLSEELEAQGANLIDTSNQMAWFQHGVWKVRFESDYRMTLVSRPLLEWNTRKRTALVPNIQIKHETAVSELISSRDNKSILGVKTHNAKDNTNVTDLLADLVVDASGRGSRTPGWLKDLGYEAPKEDHVGIDLSYTTRVFEKPAGFKEDWKFLMHSPKTPDNWRAGFVSCVEDNKWIVSLNGYFRDNAPTDDAGFLEFASTLPQPYIYNYIKNAKPISDIKIHRTPSSRWRHYQKLSRFPENLISLGDSVCSFNPIFGQGMSAAAKSAELLQKQIHLQHKKSPGNLKGFANRFRKALPNTLLVPWAMGLILDFNYPQTTGKKPPIHGILAWYVGKLLEVTSVNNVVFKEFNKVLHLSGGMEVVMHPKVSLRVLGYTIKNLFTPLEKWANTSRVPYEVNDTEG